MFRLSVRYKNKLLEPAYSGAGWEILIDPIPVSMIMRIFGIFAGKFYYLWVFMGVFC